MPASELRDRFEAEAEAAPRANEIARAARILSAMAVALGVLGLGLPLR